MKNIFRNKKTVLSLSIIALIVVIFGFVTQNNQAAADDSYKTEAATRGNISAVIEATGTVRAYQSVTLAWKTKGVVAAINSQLGDTVHAGEVLATLQKTSLPQEIIQADANLISAERALEDLITSTKIEAANAAIAVREAQSSYEDAVNYRNLLDNEVEYDIMNGIRYLHTPWGAVIKIPKIETFRYYPTDEQKAEADQDIAVQLAAWEDAQHTYDSVKDGPNKGDVTIAEAQILAAQVVINQAKITVPFDGVITEVHIQPGDQISSGALAFRVDNLSSLLIELNISEVDINNVSVGQEVIINFDAIENKDYFGEVVSVDPTGTNIAGSVNFKTTVKITNADEFVKQGMTAAVIVHVRNVDDALLVPNEAVRMLNNKRVVYVLNSDGTLRTAEILLGIRSATYSEIVSGNVQVGDLIVLNPPSNAAATQ